MNEEKSFFPMHDKDNIFIFSNHPESKDEDVFERILDVLFDEKYWKENLLIQIVYGSQIFSGRWAKFFAKYFKRSFEESIPFYTALGRIHIDYPGIFYEEMNPFDNRLIRNVLPFIYVEEARKAYINYLGKEIEIYED